jgi:2-dehydropantoate 2-reductase
MKIVILGAGAIGSLFGALLSKNNDVVLIGRRPHIQKIKKQGLEIKGIKNMKVNILAEDSIDEIKIKPDLIIISVKSYDTENIIKEAKNLISDNTLVLSLQNGLDNVDKIKKYVDKKNIFVCLTTHGAIFSEPGIIHHTGIGNTIIGAVSSKKIKQVEIIKDVFNNIGTKTEISSDIKKDMWTKVIINSSINPLTTFFQCKNGHLQENPILKNLVEKICEESTNIANKEGLNLLIKDMIKKTKLVIKDTAENHSSMLQSFQKGKKTEIDSINGKIVEIGKKHGVKTMMNEILLYSIKSIYGR